MADPLTSRLANAWQDALDDLDRADRRVADAVLSAPFIPTDFSAMLTRALAEPEVRPGEHNTLVAYHTDTLQTMRAAVLASRDEPQRTLCHTPLELWRMPRLKRALTCLFDRVTAARVAPERVFGAASPEALLAARPTLASLFAASYFGGYGPPLYLQLPDLQALARELTSDDVCAVIDRRMTAPLVHELSHLGRTRRALAPPSMDECVSAWLGEWAYPEIAVPAPGDDGALFLAAWFTQVGAHLARIVGAEPLIAAHAGVVAWDDVLPRGLAAALAELGWSQWCEGRQLSFLGDTGHPEPWIKLMWLAAGGALDRVGPRMTIAAVDAVPWSHIPRGAWTDADEALVTRAACLLATAPSQTPEGAWRVRHAPCPVRYEASTNRMVRDGVTYPLEGAPLYIVMPPGAAARLCV